MYIIIMKVKLQVWINKDLNDKLRELINQKYKKYEKGNLSNEVEEALRNWIAAHTNAHKFEQTNPEPRVYKVWEEVKKVLKDWGYFQQVNLRELKKAIAIVRGNDYRTIRKWLNEFKKFKLIKELTPQVYEII